MKVALYVRVSTDVQTEQNQIMVLERWVRERGWDLVEIYREAEGAWKVGHQKELARLFEGARLGQFAAVVVWALDRLSREGPLAILRFVDKFKHYGVKVISYQEPWTEVPGELADLLFAITGWVARMESQRRSERTKAGMARAKAEGKHVGRPPGKKDKRKRQRAGYYLRGQKRVSKNLAYPFA